MSVRESRNLFVKLTDAELAENVRLHSDLASQLEDVAVRKSAALAEFRHEAKPLRDELTRRQLIKSTGGEEREVECEWRDGQGGELILVRLDTLEIVQTEAADEPKAEKRQRALPFDKGVACESCGIVGGHHRPECAAMQADDAAGLEPDDAFDTASIAEQVAEGAEVEPKSTKLVAVKPKRGSKKPKAEAGEGVH